MIYVTMTILIEGYLPYSSQYEIYINPFDMSIISFRKEDIKSGGKEFCKPGLPGEPSGQGGLEER
jgi:hypothetical protein